MTSVSFVHDLLVPFLTYICVHQNIYVCIHKIYNAEVQVNITPTLRDAGVQCNPVQTLEHCPPLVDPPLVDASVQCGFGYSLLTLTPKIRNIVNIITSESEISGALQAASMLTEIYCPSQESGSL